MRCFVFRNQTIEPFFGDKDVGYSGYGDINAIPDADCFVWFYQPPVLADSHLVAEEAATYFDKLQMVLRRLPQRARMVVFSLEALFSVPLTGDDFDVRAAVSSFNARVEGLARADQRIRVVDFSDFLRGYPAGQLVNWRFYFISQTALNPKLAADFKAWWKRKEGELALDRKKCLVLDLDNVLWGGIVGEDGVAGIQIGGDYPGNAFAWWQQAVLQLKDSGVILTICSKNNEGDVLEVWEKNPFMVLRREHFSAWRINWRDKATNMRELAEELNIGLDSMVFIDDNPTERELIRQALPMVAVPEFSGKAYDLMPLFKELVDKYFRIYAITEEDRAKTEQYQANAHRKAELASFVNMDDYLRSLDMHVVITAVNDFNRVRIAQMTQKTNQFNLTTRRYSESDIRRMEDDGWQIYCMSVSDRFGDNGITGAIFLEPCSERCVMIDSLLLSCRILGRGIEMAFLNAVLNRLYEDGVERVRAEYIPTAKNAQVADFYDRAGFTLEDAVGNGDHRVYDLKLDGAKEIESYYSIRWIV